VTLDVGIERLYDLNVGTTAVVDGSPPHERFQLRLRSPLARLQTHCPPPLQQRKGLPRTGWEIRSLFQGSSVSSHLRDPLDPLNWRYERLTA
jgi:hypothetical protein